MPKKIELGKEEILLYNELKKLSKRANQRILRLERLTGEKGTFATKQLYDYLGASNIDAISSTGRIRVRKSYSLLQMRAIIKATEQFIKSPVSTSKGVKEYTKQLSVNAGKKLSYSQANTYYRARKNYTWIYEYMTPSEFWAFVQHAKENGWNKEKFIDEISVYIDKEIDQELKQDLEDLYEYVMGE